MKPTLTFLIPLLLAPQALLHAADSPLPEGFRSKLQATMTQHLTELLNDDGSIAEMKGKERRGLVGIHRRRGDRRIQAADDQACDHQ